MKGLVKCAILIDMGALTSIHTNQTLKLQELHKFKIITDGRIKYD